MGTSPIPHFAKSPKHETPPMLINEISRLFAAKMRETENEMQQESVRLIIISLIHQEGVTQLDLVHRTHLSPPTVSITLKKLEAAGYISRTVDTQDQRAVRVFLTEKGRQLNEASLKSIKALDAILMQGLSADETETLLNLLRRMRDNILDEFESEGEN